MPVDRPARTITIISHGPVRRSTSSSSLSSTCSMRIPSVAGSPPASPAHSLSSSPGSSPRRVLRVPTPYPAPMRREPSISSLASIYSSPDKENNAPFARSSAPSPSPSPSPKNKRTGKSGKALAEYRGVLSTPRRASSSSVSSSESCLSLSEILQELADQRAKELTESPLADVTAAFVDVIADAQGIMCPPNSPVLRRTAWFVVRSLSRPRRVAKRLFP